jgi:hypothetical protein
MNINEQSLDEVVARKFLLGQLPPEEQGQVEELAFENPDTFTFLESMEDELIDDFIQGELSTAEEQRFRDHFLSLPGRRSNLKISRVLQEHLEQTAPHPVSVKQERFSFWRWFTRQHSLLQLSLTTACVGLFLIGIWIYIRRQESARPPEFQAGPSKPVAVPTPEVKFSPPVAPTPSPVHVENIPKGPSPEKKRSPVGYGVTLLASATPRGNGAQPFNFPATGSSVLVTLVFHSDKKIPLYEATLENDAGTVHNWTNLKALPFGRAKKVELEMPAGLLTPQEFYTIILTGVSSKDEKRVVRFPFQAIKSEPPPTPKP